MPGLFTINSPNRSSSRGDHWTAGRRKLFEERHDLLAIDRTQLGLPMKADPDKAITTVRRGHQVLD